VAGNATTQVTVAYQGSTSAPVTLSVQATTPAVFWSDGVGPGNGAILNQNNSLNGKANRAARGSIVQIFLTGGGVTDPASTDGWVTTQIAGVWPLLVAQPVTVTIGGVASDRITYAGGAPGAVAGLIQIGGAGRRDAGRHAAAGDRDRHGAEPKRCHDRRRVAAWKDRPT
jgi:uncharacterized protein (TIGR03437 family)